MSEITILNQIVESEKSSDVKIKNSKLFYINTNKLQNQRLIGNW